MPASRWLSGKILSFFYVCLLTFFEHLIWPKYRDDKPHVHRHMEMLLFHSQSDPPLTATSGF